MVCKSLVFTPMALMRKGCQDPSLKFWTLGFMPEFEKSSNYTSGVKSNNKLNAD